MREHQRGRVAALLDRLGRYSEQVTVYLDETLRGQIPIDTSRIRLIPDPICR